MECFDVVDALEMYVRGDLPDAETLPVAEHLAHCESCAAEYERTRSLVDELTALGTAFVPAERFSVAQASTRSGKGWAWRALTAAAVLLAALSTTALAVPALARQLPVPLASELAELDDKAAALERQVDELTVRIESIDGEQVPVVDTAHGDLPPELNLAVQQLAMAFVRAQYDGDIEALKAMATERLRAEIEADPDEYLRAEGGSVVFAQMTEAARAEDGTFLVFIRLMDSAEWSDSQYQEDFEIKEVDGVFLVDFMGMDA